MKCTRCKQGNLLPSFIDELFRAHTCSNCKGNWVLIEDYIAWKERNPQVIFNVENDYQIDDTSQAMLCPMTGLIMRKLKLSTETEHRIDYSASVGGVWLDKGEWELLKEKALAGSLNSILTVHWQRNIRLNNSADNFAQLYKDKFGEADYSKLKDLRAWLHEQPNKADIRAYLMAEDPYSTEK